MYFNIVNEGDCVLIKMLSKTFTAEVAREYESFMQKYLKQKIIVDLSQCEYVGSGSIGTILNSWHQSGKRLALIVTNDELKKILAVTNLLQAMKAQLFERKEDAIKYLQKMNK